MNQSSIVIVEDDIDDQEILKDVFKDLDAKHELLFFTNAAEAFNHLMSVKSKPFLIISDINMPGTNGIEFKRKIDTTDYLRKKAIPFIFLSTADSQNIVDEAYAVANLQGFFKKGSSFREIRQQVKQILDYWNLSLQPR
jgi:CheY-like chemotaxis protein